MKFCDGDLVLSHPLIYLASFNSALLKILLPEKVLWGGCEPEPSPSLQSQRGGELVGVVHFQD